MKLLCLMGIVLAAIIANSGVSGIECERCLYSTNSADDAEECFMDTCGEHHYCFARVRRRLNQHDAKGQYRVLKDCGPVKKECEANGMFYERKNVHGHNAVKLCCNSDGCNRDIKKLIGKLDAHVKKGKA